MPGPLSGYRLIEMGGVGPAPIGTTLLADLGADVIRIDRADGARESNPVPAEVDVVGRSRRSIRVNLKHPEGVEVVLRLVETADGLIEGFRPGVMERLGLGPERCTERNPRIVFARMTGWGQDGPNASVAAHDINYIAAAGALAHLGLAGEPPIPPLNLVGNGVGGVFLALAVASALLEAQRSGQGQVIDVAMVNCVASLMSVFHGLRACGFFDASGAETPQTAAAHFYSTYMCADGKYISLGTVEPKFYQQFLDIMGLAGDEEFLRQQDRSLWPRLKDRLKVLFLTRTSSEWCEMFEGRDVCFAPVLTIEEAPHYPHNASRRVFLDVGGLLQPAPAPRFSRTTLEDPTPPVIPGQHTRPILESLGLSKDDIERRLVNGSVA